MLNITDAMKKLAISCLDLTTLNDTDTEDDVRVICQRATTPMGNVAAVCIAPEFVDFAKSALVDSSIRIATVANFPAGNDSIATVVNDIKKSLFDGADEIDVVLPYQAYLSGGGERTQAIDLITAAKQTCGATTLKVILETGALQDPDIIAAASRDCLLAGADFLKTSTGKITVGATLSAATIMLQAIKNHQTLEQRIIGFKASGGVRSTEDAIAYIALAQQIMGREWVSPHTFRIGASSLLGELLK